MANTNDLGPEPHPSILVVGDSGTYKTRFLGTVPDIHNYDFDKGMASLRGEDVEFTTFKDSPRAAKMVNPERGIYAWGTAWPAFIKHLNVLGAQVDEGTCPYTALGSDSITTMSDICMNYVLKEDGHAKAPQIQHWGAQIQLLQAVMDQLTAWPLTFIATAHIQRNVNNVTEVVEMLPLVTGKLAGKIGIYFDEVYYMKVEKNVKTGERKPTLITESGGMIKQAKSRYNVPNGTEARWDAIAPFIVDTPPKVAV